MLQERFNSLTLLSIEHETVRELDFSEVITNVAWAKVRRLVSYLPLVTISKLLNSNRAETPIRVMGLNISVPCLLGA